MGKYPVLKPRQGVALLGKTRLCGSASKRLTQAISASRWSEYNRAFSQRARYFADSATADSQRHWTFRGRVALVQLWMMWRLRANGQMTKCYQSMILLMALVANTIRHINVAIRLLSTRWMEQPRRGTLPCQRGPSSSPLTSAPISRIRKGSIARYAD